MNSRQILKVTLVVFGLCAQIWAQSIEDLMTSGQEMLQRGAYSQAVTAFRQVVSREPDNFEAQFNLGFAYLGWGRQSNAIEEFKKAMRLQPRNSEIWSNLAIAYENLGRTQDAINALYQAVQLNPQNTTARMNLAAMYGNANRPKDAIAQYKQVIAQNGANEEALFNLAKCLVAVNQVTEAINYFKQVIATNPNNGEAHWEMGNLYWKKDKDYDKAIAEFKLAVMVKPEASELYDNLAIVYEEKKMKAEALETWKKALATTDDILRKDKIKDRIERLELGSSASGQDSKAAVPEMNTKSQINDLKKELRQDASQQRINAAPVNVMDDLNDINTDKQEPSLNLLEEAKKRAQK
ncbi:MAG: tetratricopeptide repeat protein [Fibrobacter sp.]|nr:tetratricopeptide repeat protein [Fibrobacter sp.]